MSNETYRIVPAGTGLFILAVSEFIGLGGVLDTNDIETNLGTGGLFLVVIIDCCGRITYEYNSNSSWLL